MGPGRGPRKKGLGEGMGITRPCFLCPFLCPIPRPFFLCPYLCPIPRPSFLGPTALERYSHADVDLPRAEHGLRTAEAVGRARADEAGVVGVVGDVLHVHVARDAIAPDAL